MAAESVQVHLQHTKQWRQAHGVWARGAAFSGSRLQRGAELAKLIAAGTDADGLATRLGDLNGFYAVTGEMGGLTIAAVDRIRSIPLFYGELDGRLFISDDARWVRSQVGDRERDPEAEVEAEYLGYVTGPHTLYPRVKQLQAGEMLTAREIEGELDVQRHWYFRHRQLSVRQRGERELLAELDEATVAAVRNLIEYAGGRPIAVALSSGIDSGRIAIMLRRLGYDNLLAYSYGRVNNQDAAGARRLARQLGIRWEFAPYTEKDWRRWWVTPEREQYYEYADGLCSLPILQEWPAVWQLRERGILPADAVIVPGYSVEAFVGSKRQDDSWPPFYDDRLDPAGVARATVGRHYVLWDWRERQQELAEFFEGRVLSALGDSLAYPNSSALYEAWAICERQAKFITNAVRTYEFWGFDWWLPLWDAELLPVWSSMPTRYRRGRRLSRRYFEMICGGLDYAPYNPSLRMGVRTAFHRSAGWLRELGQRWSAAAVAYQALQRQLKYGTHPLAWYGIIPPRLFKQLFFGGANINSYLVLEWLGRLSFEAERRPAAPRG